jgi:hypothetical protein
MSARTSSIQPLRWIPSPETLKQGFSRQPVGSWVAISLDDKRVVGQGATPAKAEQQARLAGETATFLVRVPGNGSGREPKPNGHAGDGNGQLSTLSLPSLYRGIYKRVAHKLRCDPSYVSRVARGERISHKVSSMLRNEIERTLHMSNKSNGHRAKDAGR